MVEVRCESLVPVRLHFALFGVGLFLSTLCKPVTLDSLLHNDSVHGMLPLSEALRL